MTILHSGHGGGGRLSSELIEKIGAIFAAEGLPPGEMEDCALLSPTQGISMDSFTVTPRFFPGGSLGKLAVCGSLNDVTVRGMRPFALLLGIIAEEGLEEEELHRHLKDAATICAAEGVHLLGGDTKVVPRGGVDGLFLSTCAVGDLALPEPPGMTKLRPGDALVITGAPGRHGAAIAACRYNLSTSELESDCASLWGLLEPLFSLKGFRCARDATRGGLTTVLCEWAEARHLGMELEEEALPRHAPTESLCDLLGLDPLTLACEGTAVIALDAADAPRGLELLRNHPLGKDAACIGRVVEDHPSQVGLRTSLGGLRVLDMPVGDPLPRIC